jgi:hypothetical protein
MRTVLTALMLTSCAPSEGSDPALPPPVYYTHTDLVRGQTATFSVSGLALGDTVHFARSFRGTGRGPCFHGTCLDLRDPVTLLGSAVADMDGVARLELRIPETAAPVWVYSQALIDSFAGFAATPTQMAPIFQGGLDHDRDGYCAGEVCQDPAVLPGDCADDSPEAFPDQPRFFSLPLPAPDPVAAWDYDCDGQVTPMLNTAFSCVDGPRVHGGPCASFAAGWVGEVAACGESSVFGFGCVMWTDDTGVITCRVGEAGMDRQACR